MWIDIVLLAVAAIALAGLAVVIGRHMRQVGSVDVEALPSTAPARLKQRLLEQRLQRQLQRLGGPAANIIKRQFGGVYQWAHQAAERLVALEESYRRRLLGKPLSDVLAQQKQRRAMVREAEVLIEQEKYADAEKVYIELVRIDPYSVEVYEGLGTLYYRQRQYDEARQTFEHLAKLHGGAEVGYSGLGLVAAERGDLGGAVLAYKHSVTANPRVAGNHYNLAKVYEALEDIGSALEQVQSALVLEPDNPRYLDYATSLAILQRDVPLAQELLERLATANPDNQKINQYQQTVRELYTGASTE